MKFAIFGTGGVGGYFGGRLAKAGNDVTFIARGRHLAQITETGLRVDSIGGNFLVEPAKATDSPQSIGEVDCVLVATKAWQLTEAIKQMHPLVGERTTILPLLNGIEHVDMLVDAFGSRVLGGLCRISSFMAAPGHITHVNVKPFITYGELDRQKSERIEQLHGIFSALGGMDAELSADILVAMWEKFIFICATSGVGALTRQSFGVFRSVQETRAMLRSSIEETCKLGFSKGIQLPSDISELIMKRIDSLPETMVASMQKDIMEGRPSELESQTGAILRMGKRLGIPTPTHAFIYASLLPMEIHASEKKA